MLETQSLIRVIVFSFIYAGIEYRYINRREEEWTGKIEGFYEKSIIWKFSPYHIFLLFPLFITVSFAQPISAWAGNVFLVALVEDLSYFIWRGRFVKRGEWTTQILGSIDFGKYALPLWWPLALIICLLLFSIQHF